MYDIIIVGAGPAGANLARLIGKEYKVLLLEKRDLAPSAENGINKPCGGLIAPDAQRVMGALGLALPKKILVNPQIFVVRSIDLQINTERFYQRFYLNVDREAFDGWLNSLIAPDVDISYNSFLQDFFIEPDDSDGIDSRKKIKVQYRRKGKVYTVSCKLLVGADGASSLVRKKLRGKNIENRYISIQEIYKADFQQNNYSAIFDRDITDFYSWTIPKEDSLILGSALKIGDNPVKKFNLLKQKLNHFGYRFDHKIRREGAQIVRPLGGAQVDLGQGSVLLIGEAAGLISPSSAEGISYALKSSYALANELLRGLEKIDKRYRRQIWKLKLNILGKSMKSLILYNPFLRNIMMKSRLSSIDMIGNMTENDMTEK